MELQLPKVKVEKIKGILVDVLSQDSVGKSPCHGCGKNDDASLLGWCFLSRGVYQRMLESRREATPHQLAAVFYALEPFLKQFQSKQVSNDID